MKECRIAHLKLEQALKKLFLEKGIPRNKIEAIQETFDRKPKQGENYYYWSGPDDKKTRAFCKLMLKIDKVISETDLKKLSDSLGYDVIQFKGGYNCRHKLVRFRGKFINTPPLTTTQIRNLIGKGIKV